MTTSQVLWPRHYAAAIVAGTMTIEDVPEHLRELVQSNLRIREMHYNHEIDSLARYVLRGDSKAERNRRLELVPDLIRGEVEARVREEWQRRAEAV